MQLQNDLALYPEVITSGVIWIDKLQVGNIIDAQDYLGNWHPAIVIDERSEGSKFLHFLPFTKANRDEEFKESESVRTNVAFSMTKFPIDNNVKSLF